MNKITEKCKHTPCPDGYLQWSSWAEKKAQTHYQIKCPHCELYAIWKPKGTMRFTGSDLVVGRVLHEDEAFMTVEIIKDETRELSSEQGDSYYTMAFIKMDNGKATVWKPWDE